MQKMSSYLITHSLLSAWIYAIKDTPYESVNTERNPIAEFMKVLCREPTRATEAMQRGIDFENLVENIMKGNADTNNRWYKAATKISSIVGGGVWQLPVSKRICINGINIVLYGRLDALKAGGIYDIKFSSNYERGKYFDSTQHPVYLELVPEAQHFTYLVTNGYEVWQERYRRDETQSIHSIVSDFMDWLGICGLMQLYRTHWSVK